MTRGTHLKQEIFLKIIKLYKLLINLKIQINEQFVTEIQFIKADLITTKNICLKIDLFPWKKNKVIRLTTLLRKHFKRISMKIQKMGNNNALKLFQSIKNEEKLHQLTEQ